MLKHCLLALLLFGISTTDGAMAKSNCRLSADEKLQNAHLSFDDFDQTGTTTTTWRHLERFWNELTRWGIPIGWRLGDSLDRI